MDDLGESEANKMTANAHRKQKKKEVCERVLAQLSQDGHGAVTIPGFAEELQAHFNRLPTRYALDVHIDRAEDVLTHKRLLEEAKLNENRAAFHLRAVHQPDSFLQQNSETVVEESLEKMIDPIGEDIVNFIVDQNVCETAEELLPFHGF